MPTLTQTLTTGSGDPWSPATHSTGPIDGYLVMEGTFNSGTVTWEARPAGTADYAPITGMEFTASESGAMVMHPGIEYRPTHDGSGHSIVISFVYDT